MSAIDKAKNKVQEMMGKGKEAAGGATGNHHLKNEGKGDQGSANVKQGGEHVKDAAGDAKDKLTGN